MPSRLQGTAVRLVVPLLSNAARSERARRAVIRAIGVRRFEFFSGCLAFIRTAHYWTVLHPEIESEDDMLSLLRGQEELAKLLLEDAEADRCEMGERAFEELTTLRDLHERQELEKAKKALEEKDRQKDEFIAVLAHELRNPLATIRASADALARLKIPDERITACNSDWIAKAPRWRGCWMTCWMRRGPVSEKCRFKWSRLRSSHS